MSSYNVIAFDQPGAGGAASGLLLHRLPLIDTLELAGRLPRRTLSPAGQGLQALLTRNDPVRDAELAYALCRPERGPAAALSSIPTRPPACISLAPENGKGVANLFATCAACSGSLAEAAAAWQRACAGRCITGQRWLLEHCRPTPAGQAAGLCAGVAGGGRQFGVAALGLPELSSGAQRPSPRARVVRPGLRGAAISTTSRCCCRAFTFRASAAFAARPPPRTGARCNQAIVENSFADRPSLAILPTGAASRCVFSSRRWRFTANGPHRGDLAAAVADEGPVDTRGGGVACASYLTNLLNLMGARAMLASCASATSGRSSWRWSQSSTAPPSAMR